MDVPYYLCGRRDANVNVCRQLCNWMCQPTSQLTLLNLQLCFTLWSRRGCRAGTAARRPEDRLLSASWLHLHFSLLLKNFLRAAGVTMCLGLPPDRRSAASWRSLDSCWCLDDCVGPFHETQNSETYITAKNLTHCTRRLSPLSLHSFVHLTQARTDKAHFNHGETWQQKSASILNLINGNDSSVIHLSKVAFSVPLPPHSRKGWTQFGERPSLLLLTKRRPGSWGKHFLSEIR